MKKRSFALSLIVLVTGYIICGGTPALAETFKNEPDGFRGMKWETDISTLSGMRCTINPLDSNENVCRKKRDKLQISGVKLRFITYEFYKDKFSAVTIFTKGPVNFNAIKDIFFMKFGSGKQENEAIKNWYWTGDITNVILDYHEPAQIGTLYMSSQKINQARFLQVGKDKNQKAK